MEKIVDFLLEHPTNTSLVILHNLQEFLAADPPPAGTADRFFRQLSQLDSLHTAVLHGIAKSFLPEDEYAVRLIQSVIESGREVASRLRDLLQDKE